MNQPTYIQIINGQLIDPLGKHSGQHNLFIAHGRIVGIGQVPEGFQAEQTIDAQGQWILPGIVDLSARLREPGFEYKATLESEMLAAIAGGVTSLACPPDTDPALDEPGLVEMLKHRTAKLSQANVYPIGALTKNLAGEQLTEMAELVEAGCVAFSQAEQPILNTQVLLRAMQYARTFDFPIWLRPQDYYLSQLGVAHHGSLGGRLGLVGVPIEAETIALHTYIELARSTNARLHICRISSAAGIQLIRQAKAEGLRITCDVGIHHVHLCDTDIGFFDAHARLSPPLRSSRDRDAIHTALRDGTIDAICSDHSPVDDDGKQLPFGEAEIGATGLELLLPLTLQWATQHVPVNQYGQLVEHAVGLISHQAANILGIDAGKIAINQPADLCVFDPNQHWQVTANALKSQGHNTPFINYELQGKVTHTLVNGQLVYSFNAH